MKLIVVNFLATGYKYAINTNKITTIDHIPATDSIVGSEEVDIYFGKKFVPIKSVSKTKNNFSVKCFNKDKSTKYDHKEVNELSEIYNDIINFCTERNSGTLVIEVKK